MRFLQGCGAGGIGIVIASAVVGAAVVACSSDSTPATGSHKDGGSSGTSGSSGSSGSPAVDGTLGGTWDVIATADDQSQSTGTVSIATTALSVKVGGTTLSYRVNGASATLNYIFVDVIEGIAVTHTDKAFDTGVFLLPLGGDWTFKNGKTTCTSLIGTDSVFTCDGHADFPDPFPNPRASVAYAGKRTKTADSSFGELGGEWSFGTVDDPDGCEASFSGKKVHLQCTSIERLNGAIDITFSDDFTSLSGNTSGDFELTGQKK